MLWGTREGPSHLLLRRAVQSPGVLPPAPADSVQGEPGPTGTGAEGAGRQGKLRLDHRREEAGPEGVSLREERDERTSGRRDGCLQGQEGGRVGDRSELFLVPGSRPAMGQQKIQANHIVEEKNLNDQTCPKLRENQPPYPVENDVEMSR